MLRRLVPTLAVVLATTGAGVALAASSHTLSATGDLKTTSGSGLKFVQSGKLTSNLGDGTLRVKSTIKKGRIVAYFEARLNGARVRGKAEGKVDVQSKLTYVGTAHLTSGTGRYKHIVGKSLKYSGVAPLNGRSAKVSISGTIRY